MLSRGRAKLPECPTRAAYLILRLGWAGTNAGPTAGGAGGKTKLAEPVAPRVVSNRLKALLLGAELLGSDGACRAFLVGILHLGPQSACLIHLARRCVQVGQIKLRHTGSHGL